MKVAIIGTGTITTSLHIPILKSIPEIEISAICDSNEKRLERVANEFKIQNRYSDVDEMLKEVNVDFVDLGTPGYTHFEIAKKVISANYNLLVEKPAALNVNDLENLNKESRKKNLKVGVIQNYRYRDPVIKFQKIRENGGIGNIDRMITIQRGSTVFAQPKWFWDEKVSGGILFELGIHAIDLQCYLMGAPQKVLSVTAFFDEALKFTTSISAIIKFENGIGIVDLKWYSSSFFFHNYISGSVADAILKFIPDSLILQHADFTPLAEAIGEVKRLWNFGYTVLRKKYAAKRESPHRIIFEDFIKALKTDTQPLVSLEDVIPTIRTIEEIRSKAGY